MDRAQVGGTIMDLETREGNPQPRSDITKRQT